MSGGCQEPRFRRSPSPLPSGVQKGGGHPPDLFMKADPKISSSYACGDPIKGFIRTEPEYPLVYAHHRLYLNIVLPAFLKSQRCMFCLTVSLFVCLILAVTIWHPLLDSPKSTFPIVDLSIFRLLCFLLKLVLFSFLAADLTCANRMGKVSTIGFKQSRYVTFGIVSLQWPSFWDISKFFLTRSVPHWAKLLTLSLKTYFSEMYVAGT